MHYTRERRSLLPLFPPREERVGERRVILLVAGVWNSSGMPLSPALSPLVPHGEREWALSPILRPPQVAIRLPLIPPSSVGATQKRPSATVPVQVSLERRFARRQKG